MEFQEIIAKLELAVENTSLSRDRDLNPEITGVAAVDRATSGSLSYIEGGKFAQLISETAASALILPLDESLQARANERNIAWIATKDPRLLFAKAIALFYRPFRPEPAIHPSATIAPDACLGKDIYLGANVVIHSGVKIGDRVCIHPNVVIYPDAVIGDDTVLHANCTIHERSQIGANCLIHSGAVIGAEGFGFVPTSQGWYKMQQSGCVVLENGVEIGCNTTIDRPAVGETRVGRNTKLDNLVQIGHGCHIGQNCAFAAQVGLAGGVTVGNGVMLGGQVGVANQVKIGDGAIATGQTGITNDVPGGEMVSGMPHLPSKLYRKLFVIYKRLPEIYQLYREFQKKQK